MVQKALNALYGAVAFMRNNREATIKLIADLYEMPSEIAALEYENTILKLETDGNMAASNVSDAVQLSLDLAKLGGLLTGGVGRLLHGRVFRRLPGQLHHLLVTLAACSRADDKADGEASEERGLESHLAPLSRMSCAKHDLPPLREGTRQVRL